MVLGSSAFASFNIFDCTYGKLHIVKPMAYKNGLDIIGTDPSNTEYTNINETDPPFDNGSGTVSFLFKSAHLEGSYQLYSLVITERGLKKAKARLYQVHIDGTHNRLVASNLNCRIE